VSPEIADRLARQNFQLLSEGQRHFLIGRDACVALVERTATGFGSIGSTGLMTESGLVYLVWRDSRALLAGKSGQIPAAPGQVDMILRFSRELQAALSL
jgi:hypothetical protein